MEHKYTLARNLRKNSTNQESVLWQILRNRKFYGYKFKRQHPIGKYILDFICEEKRITIELDGSQHNEPQNIKKDNNRTEFLMLEGYRVVRIWNNDIDNNLEGVYLQLQKEFGIAY